MSKDAKKIIKTIHFGEMEVEDSHVFHFNDGLLGFEDLKEFVLVSEEESEPFKWLISMSNPDIGFPLLNPWLLDLNYNPGRSVDLEKEVVFSVITLANADNEMTANLKAPVIIDTSSNEGRQIILPSDKYSPHFSITRNATKEKS